jgi:hypothetical protein
MSARLLPFVLRLILLRVSVPFHGRSNVTFCRLLFDAVLGINLARPASFLSSRLLPLVLQPCEVVVRRRLRGGCPVGGSWTVPGRSGRG